MIFMDNTKSDGGMANVNWQTAIDITIERIQQQHIMLVLCYYFFIYFPTTQLFDSTMVLKNQHAHTKKAIAGAGGALGGRPVTRITMCTYSTLCGPQTPP